MHIRKNKIKTPSAREYVELLKLSFMDNGSLNWYNLFGILALVVIVDNTHSYEPSPLL